jgi:pyrroline-5-carboxylate reductase
MKQYTIGFIGGGRITKIILSGWKRAGVLPDEITVTDTNEDPLRALKKEFDRIETVVNDVTKPASCDIVFLAVHPPAMSGILQEIRSALKSSAIVVSLAPKISIAKISEQLGGFNTIVRANPNAPSLVNAGYNPIVFSRTMNDEQKNIILDLFRPLGDCPEVEEELLESFAITTAMGPTYLWFQLYELHQLAESFGILNETLKNAIPKMLLGAIKTMYESGLSPSEVMDLVPVKPLGDQEAMIKGFYQDKLNALYKKLKSS